MSRSADSQPQPAAPDVSGSLATTPLTAEQTLLLRERYGPAHQRSVLLTALIASVAIAFLGWVIWAAAEQAATDVRWRTIGYSAVSDTSITVEFDVFKPAASTATCVIRALDDTSTEVGRAEVPISSAQSDVNVVYALPVTALPTTAEVEACQLDE